MKPIYPASIGTTKYIPRVLSCIVAPKTLSLFPKKVNSLDWSFRKRIIHQKSSLNEQQKTDEDHEGYSLSNSQIKAIRLLKVQQSDTRIKSAAISPLAALKEQSMQQDLEHELNKPSPWFNLLLHPSRALWRSSPEPPPKYITDMQFQLIQKSGRKTKQLKRTNEIILKQQRALLQSRELERRQYVNGIRSRSPTRYTSIHGQSPSSTIESNTTPIYYKPEYTLCSLKFRLIPNYSITKRVLAETQSLIGITQFQPKRILDVGCGVGSASAAALEYFHQGRGIDRGFHVQWIHAIDPSQSMKDAAKNLLQDIIQQAHKQRPDTSSTRITFGDSLTSTPSSYQTSTGFDLALCVYTLCEIPSVASTLSMAAIIWEKLAVDGVAIFIEPGTPDGFNALRSVRSMLLECCPPSKSTAASETQESGFLSEECHVIAPCTHNGECPMERHKKDFFHKSEEQYDESKGGSDDDFWENKMDDYGFQKSVDTMEDDEEDDDFDLEPQDEDVIASSTSETNVFTSAFCSFVHGLPGGTTRTTGEKFCYLVVQKRVRKSNQSQHLDAFTNLSLVDLLKSSMEVGDMNLKNNRIETDETPWNELLNKAVELEDIFVQSDEDTLGLELVRGDRNRKRFGRIVRAPIKKRGHILLDYCSLESNASIDSGLEGQGTIIRHKISRGKSIRMAPGMFAAARKARWGGLWPNIRR